ncbi:RNA polymerase II holoenzyme cyclin-like subunit [Podospora australis]|uniref:RNA polymerase II holoenzyme cyclin-like subunit n=1 Tax=Podospora australis TaxID=1536484 RepID=A0AAN6WRC8_9PEZI|nr:RNA polymerase II holoenzyme cyclin-like subunit [Podospora australis]
MAANFWESTQRRYWLFSKDELAAMRQKLEDEDPNLVQSFPLPELRHLNIYFNQQINRLGKRLGVRQQALATAQVYIKRFYTRVEIRRTNPYLVIATSLYLACKMEECPQHIRLVVQEARGLWPTELHGQDTSKLGECEFFLISEMSSQLIVHQPYRTLTTLQNDLGLTADEAQGAWSVINDHYMTDLPLLYPPHVIALTAVLLAMVLRPSPPGGNMAGGGSGQPNSAGGLAMAASTLAQMQAAQQAHAARMAAAGGGGGSGIGSAPGTPTLTPQGSYSGQTPQVGEYPSQTKKIPDARFVKVQRFSAWLAESNVDIEGMIDCTQELISFYECHEGYNDKGTREQINRFIKARGLDK